jgi:uracil-DNA glycosylase
VALGATALMALTGENVTLKGTRGKILTIKKHPSILPTYHPSAILRNEGNSSVLQQDFFADIASIKKHIDNFQTAGTSMFVNR